MLIVSGNQRHISPICMDYPWCRRDRCDSERKLDYSVRSACKEQGSCSHRSRLQACFKEDGWNINWVSLQLPSHSSLKHTVHKQIRLINSPLLHYSEACESDSNPNHCYKQWHVYSTASHDCVCVQTRLRSHLCLWTIEITWDLLYPCTNLCYWVKQCEVEWIPN